MFTFTRKEGQAFTIGNNATVHIRVARNGKAKISVDAPKDVEVRRDDMKSTKRPKSGIFQSLLGRSQAR